MITARGLAKHYLRYWDKGHDGVWRLADNAPTQAQICVHTLPKTVSQNTAYEAMRIVSGGSALERPLPMLIAWLASNSAATNFVDVVLAAKTPPRSLQAVLEKAYAAELLTARNHITTYLDQYISA